MKQTAVLLSFVIAGLLAPTGALADPRSEAKQHMTAAAQAYKAQRYEDVLVELNKAYALDPKPELHYSIGQVYVKLGRCEDAIPAYEKFLASKPTRERTAVANEAIATCKAQLAEQAAKAPPVTPVEPPAPTEPTEPAAPPAAEENPLEEDPLPAAAPTTTPRTVEDAPSWYKDPLGLALTGGGVALTITGIIFYANARSDVDAAGTAATYQESADLYDDARSKRVLSAVFVIGGLAATGLGVYRLGSKRSDERRDERSLAIAPTTGGGLVIWSGGF